METDHARLNITYSGQNGDLPDPIPVEATDSDIRNWATEAVRNGSVPGIPADANVSFEDFVIDRFTANEERPFALVHLRPKTPFGS